MLLRDLMEMEKVKLSLKGRYTDDPQVRIMGV